MKGLNILLATAAVALSGPAFAQATAPATAPAGTAPAGPAAATTTAAPANVAVGAKVSDTKGGDVGTIDAVNGDMVTLNTGTNKVQLPKASFAASGTGLLLGMTKAEVDAAAMGAKADRKAELATQLAPGTKVTDTKGGEVGTIEAADAQFVTVATANSKVKLPVSAFAAGETGPVIAMTASELDAAAKSAAPTGG